VGGFQTQNAGSTDAFVTKLAANGSGIIKSSYLGGSGRDHATGVELGTGAKQRNGLYVTGNTDSRNFPLKNATQTQYGGGNQDGFLAIVHSVNFQRLLSTYVGGEGSDQVTSLALNPARGDLYAAGIALDSSSAYITHFKPRSGGNGPGLSFDSLTEAFDESYAFRFAVKWAIVFDSVNIRGPLHSNASPNIMVAASGCVPQAPATTCTENAVLLTYDQDLNPQGAFNFGGTGPGSYFINDVVTTKLGVIHMVGDTLIRNLPLVNPIQATHKGGWEGFVITLAPGNQTTFYSYLGGTKFDFAKAVAVDKNGNILVAGGTSSRQFPTTPGALDRTLGGSTDGFVIKISP
jgi:hypothetical protein